MKILTCDYPTYIFLSIDKLFIVWYTMNEYKQLIHSQYKRRSIQLDKKQALKDRSLPMYSLKKGYKATAISEIAKQAGVAVGSFYNYYDSKEAIFF